MTHVGKGIQMKGSQAWVVRIWCKATSYERRRKLMVMKLALRKS